MDSIEESIQAEIKVLKETIGKEYKVTETQEDTFVLWSGGSRVIECESLYDISNVLGEIMDVTS